MKLSETMRSNLLLLHFGLATAYCAVSRIINVNAYPTHAVDLQREFRRNLDVNGNGITFPSANSPLSAGDYVLQFTTRDVWNWSTIYVDLYTTAGGQVLIANLVTMDYIVALDPMNPTQGRIPFTITSDFGTGPMYLIKVHSSDRTSGDPIKLPDSEIVSIVDGSAGVWNQPNSTSVWFTGQSVNLNFTLGAMFGMYSSMRLELASAALGYVYTVMDNIPVDPNALNPPAGYRIVPFVIPVSFRLNQFYYVRLVPTDGLQSSSKFRQASSGLSTFSLPSASFTIFESSVLSTSLLNLTLDQQSATTSQPATLTAGLSASFTWSWVGTGKVATWYLDLYSVGQTTQLFTGQRIANVSGSATKFSWPIPSALNDGMYFVRLYGWTSPGAPVGDPASAISKVFFIKNPKVEPIFSMLAYTAQPWSIGCLANITWKAQTVGNDVTINGWQIDLYKNTRS
ncbi:hypothetical protein DFJ73DRAFT_420317 [Zopfochytrium polystomum]|nr:hypothetical protein DFJ73DRAFT_420317 [Zopfochytrium polystomum]